MDGAEQVAAAVANFAKFNTQIAQKLSEVEGDFIAGPRLTIADFVIASLYLSLAFNEGNDREVRTLTGQKVSETPIVVAYLEKVKGELADYMATRDAYPI